MDHKLNGGIARARVDGMIARADSDRLAKPESRRQGSSRPDRFRVRRALAAVALSLVLVLALASAALAVPTDSGGGSSERSIVKTSHKERGVSSSGVPVAGPLIVLTGGSGIAIVLLAARRRYTARA